MTPTTPSTQLIQYDNGDIEFPRKGNPPTYKFCNFTQDPKDPFIYRANWVKCRFQRMALKVMPCGKEYKTQWCDLLDKAVSPKICQECTKREEPT